MQSELSEVVSAFVDGEPVDPVELASALAKPGGREALLDFMLLRAGLVEEVEPSPGFARKVRDRLAGARARSWARPLKLLAASAILVLATLGALDLGRSLRGGRPDAPPKATRVIRFQPGVDWHDSES